MKFPRIDIIIPTFNRPEKAIQVLKSIQNVNYPKENLYIYVVDDNSTVDLSKLQKFIKSSKLKIKQLKTPRNLGPAAARNLGIKKSKGEYLFFTDDDCLISKEIFKTYVSFLEKNKNVVGAGGYLVPLDKNIFSRIELLKDKILKIDDKGIKIGRNLPVGFTSNVIYKRKIFEEFGGFNEKIKIPAGEDLELKKIICKKYDMASLPTIVYHNHKYNWDYLLGIILKQGLGKLPHQNKYNKILTIVGNFPFLIYNVIKKTMDYRRN